MKRALIVIGILIFALLLFVFNILNSTGYFRTIENKWDGEIIKQVSLKGTEDMVVSEEDNFLLISATDRASRMTGEEKEGDIYFMDLTSTNFEVKNLSESFTKPFYPHGIDLIKIDSSRYKLFVINHVKGINSVEVFSLYDRDSLVHDTTLMNNAMFSPNDIVAVGENQFYFTNDKKHKEGFGKIRENYGGLAACEITYFDGESYRIVADGFSYANGINYDIDRKLMYIASTRGFFIKVFKIEDNGDLTFIEKIDCGTGVDNIELDENGHIWIGAHPNLLAYQAYSKGNETKAPSEILKIVYTDKGNYTKETVFMDDGSNVSGSSVAAVYKDYIFVGNVMDDHFLVLKK